MDLVGGGDMFQLLEARGQFPEQWVVVYAAEVSVQFDHMYFAYTFAYGRPLKAPGHMASI